MNSVISGRVVIGLIILFLVGTIAATSLTLSIGGSGGVFAPSLFIGAMAGMAFGEAAHSVFGPSMDRRPCMPWWRWEASSPEPLTRR